jgi:hypothetical protein
MLRPHSDHGSNGLCAGRLKIRRGPRGGGNPSPSVARVWPTNNSNKGWPLATRLRRAKGLDRACCSAFVSHQEGSTAEVRAAQAASQFAFTAP